MPQRPTRTLLIAALAVALIAVAGAAPAQTTARGAGLPPADEIVARALERVRREHAAKKRFLYRRLAERSELDGDGKVAERAKLEYRAVLIEGEAYDRLVLKNGQPLDEEAQAAEREREEQWREHHLEEQRERADEPFFDAELAARFQIEVVGQETVGGRPAYVLTFTPDTSKALPEREDEDRFLNAMQGRVWIDVEEAAIARIHARLMRKVRFGLGLVAYFKKIDLRFDLRRRADGEWLPHAARTYVWGRSLLFKPIRMQENSRFSDFRRVR